MPLRNTSKKQIQRLNNIIDNKEYDVKYKGVDGYQAHSKSTLIMASNYLPFDKDNRRYGIVYFNEISYLEIDKQNRDKYFPNRTESEYNQLFLDLFESCPFDKVYKERLEIKEAKLPARYCTSFLHPTEYDVERIKNLPDIHRDPFDRMLIAQAIEKNLTIITRDLKIPLYEVKTVW